MKNQKLKHPNHKRGSKEHGKHLDQYHRAIVPVATQMLDLAAELDKPGKSISNIKLKKLLEHWAGSIDIFSLVE